MELFQFAMLLLVQLSPIFIHANGEAVTEYKCANEHNTDVTVNVASAKLTKGCVMNGTGVLTDTGSLKGILITFDIKTMYEATKKNPAIAVVIDISEAVFINTHIKLIDVHLIPGDNATQGPLMFTMRCSNMSGKSKLEFGSRDQLFKLPPNSRISIIDSELTFSSTSGNTYIFFFTFHSLYLVTNSSMEISRNVIKVECIRCMTIVVFYLPTETKIKISDKSSFTLSNNKVTVKSHASENLKQYFWYQDNTSPQTISQNSIYTWVSNIISMVGYDLQDQLEQYVWFRGWKSPLTVSQTSTYTWTSNKISLVGNNAKWRVYQYVWYHGSSSPLTISQTSTYRWASNDISMVGHNIDSNLGVEQYVWYHDSSSPLTISHVSSFMWVSNIMYILGYEVGNIEETLLQYVWFQDRKTLQGVSNNTISDSSSMVWKDNCMGMGHKVAYKRHVFGGKWGITGDNSELLLDGNYITITDKYGHSSTGLTELVWGPTGYMEITISNAGKLTIQNTKVYTNNATEGATGILWNSSLSTYNTNVKHPALEWSSSPAKDSDGSPIPTLDNTNLLQYMCVGLPGILPTLADASTPTVPSLVIPTKVKREGEYKGVTPVVNTHISPMPGETAVSDPKQEPTTPTVKSTEIPISGTKPVSPNPGSITLSPNKGNSNVTKTTDSVKSAAAILSAIPGVLITSVVFLCLYIW